MAIMKQIQGSDYFWGKKERDSKRVVQLQFYV